MGSAHEHFSAQFAAWEVRGRGWQVFDRPIYPEPPFAPFVFRSPAEIPAVDDGRRQTFLSSLARRLAAPTRPATIVPVEPEPEPEPTTLIRGELVELQMALPADLVMAKDTFEHFLNSTALCREPVAFELLGGYRRVLAQFVAATEDVSLVRKQLAAFFPDVPFSERQGTLQNAWTASEGNDAFAVEFGLQHEFMLPLATGKLDPFVGIVAAMAELRPGELGLFQVLWQPVQNPWAESITGSVTHSDGKPFFVNAPELAAAAEKKVAKPLFAVVVRILARTPSRARLYEIARDLASSLRVFSQTDGNALIPIRNNDYPYLPHLEDVIFRRSRRAGMLLNSEELTGFVHLPSSAVRSPVLLRDAGLTKAAPGCVRQSGIVLGDNEHDGDTVAVYLTPEQRVRHTHIIGSSGTGKSSLLFNLIRQDIENGEGVGVLDPHGDLINQILGVIPDDRIDDVVLVDPSDINFPIGFNILQAHSDEEKELLASDLIAVFRRLSTSWGDQMDTVLQNAILAILESTQGGTLADLRMFLLDTKGTQFRKQFLKSVTDREVVLFWEKVFPQLTGNKSIGPVLTRLQDFFIRKPLRNMVGQSQNRLDFADIMDRQKIFLARLPEGCGEENSYLLGTLLVSKFQQLAMARQSRQADQRKKFWLYIDEFDHFITPSMAKILSSVRKYGLGLTLAHQELHQLQSDAKVASAVMTQPCTRVVFKVGDDDAKKLGEGFESFDARSLKNLAKFHAIARVERNDFDFNLAVRKPELPDEEEAQSQREKIIAASRARYARQRAEVEMEILARIWGDEPQPPPADETGGTPAPKPPPPSPVSAVSGSAKTLVPPPSAEPVKILEIPQAVTLFGTVPDLSPLVPPKVSEPPPVAGSPQVAENPKPAGTTESKELGRGKALHKSIQKRLKEGAQKYGFLSNAEKQLTKASNEAADLVLELRPTGLVIAVEIAISPNTNHEFDNVKKCLAAGFTRVVVIATGRKLLENIAAAVQAGLGSEAAAKVGYHTPDEFLDELKQLAKKAEETPSAKPVARTEKVLGFQVTRNFPIPPPQEQKASDQAVHEVAKKAIQK